jgi:hypothetical protein
MVHTYPLLPYFEIELYHIFNTVDIHNPAMLCAWCEMILWYYIYTCIHIYTCMHAYIHTQVLVLEEVLRRRPQEPPSTTFLAFQRLTSSLDHEKSKTFPRPTPPLHNDDADAKDTFLPPRRNIGGRKTPSTPSVVSFLIG